MAFNNPLDRKKAFNPNIKTNWTDDGVTEIMDETPSQIETELSPPESVEDIVRKHALKREYLENLHAMALRMGAGEDIDDEFNSDEEAFSAAEREFIKSQEDYKAKKEAYFKANEEKVASELAKRKEEYRKKIELEAKNLGLISEGNQPKAPTAGGTEG